MRTLNDLIENSFLEKENKKRGEGGGGKAATSEYLPNGLCVGFSSYITHNSYCFLLSFCAFFYCCAVYASRILYSLFLFVMFVCCLCYFPSSCLFDLHEHSTKFPTISHSIHTVADHRPVKNQTHIDQTTAPSPQPDSGFIALVVIASLSACAVVLSVVG